MYCRMCGKKIDDTDHYCQFCGAPTGYREPSSANSEEKEEIIFNPPYDDNSRLTEEEDLKDFISENEIEEAQQEEEHNKEEDEAESQEVARNPEFTWNVYEFPNEKKKTEEVEFNWNMEEFGQPEQRDPEAEAASFEEELFQEIRDDSSRSKDQNIDRFFTFSRKNEEFQELLDKEYEKFKLRSEPVAKSSEVQPTEPSHRITMMEPQVKVIKESGIPEAVPLQEIHIEGENLFETAPETITEELHAERIEEREGEPVEEQEIEQAVVNETEQAVVNETEQAVELESEEDQAAEPEEVREPAVEAAEPEKAPKAEHITEMALARAQFFGGELVKDNESIRKRLTFGDPEEEQIIEVEAVTASEPPVEIYEEGEGDYDHRAESVAAAYAAAALAKEEEEKEIQPMAEPDDIPVAALAIEGEAEENEKPKRSAGQIVLAVIAVILVIEIAILGIRYFAPESSAAKAIGDTQTRIFNTVAGWIGADSAQDPEDEEALPEDSEKSDQGSADEEKPPAVEVPDDTEQSKPAADPNPIADKNALVTSQLGNNKNIEQIKANEALSYQQGKNYGLSDINNSKPITNNIWQAPETGEPVYYDKSIVGTVIAFDSQWIDYVHGNSRSVLDLLKKDSNAYKNTLAYSKIGKVKEAFKLLEIGEIRQGANGFYIWVHEEIRITENGATADKKYNWIYYLEPADGQMKIVDYYKF